MLDHTTQIHHPSPRQSQHTVLLLVLTDLLKSVHTILSMKTPYPSRLFIPDFFCIDS